MALDRRLIDTIKTHFAGKSTAQLEEIVRAEDRDQWSEESFAAAREILAARAAGSAAAPKVPMAEPSAPQVNSVLPLVALAAGGFWFGWAVKTLLEPDPTPPDKPVPFGTDTAWLAVDSRDTRAVAAALGLKGPREATWDEGLAGARRSHVFVTPPVGDWTLAVAAALLPPRQMGEVVKPLLEALSRQFGEAQYFCTHGGMGLHGWGRARKGGLVRGYGWLGAESVALWDEGAATREERAIRVQAQGDPGTAAEDDVLQLAAAWSVDPTTLDEHFQEPIPGLLGTAGWAAPKP